MSASPFKNKSQFRIELAAYWTFWIKLISQQWHYFFEGLLFNLLSLANDREHGHLHLFSHFKRHFSIPLSPIVYSYHVARRTPDWEKKKT